MNNVLVIGSLNMDFDVYTSRRPAPGETVMGQSMKMVPGGKGANQAYALARMKVKTSMIGAVGDDPFGRMLVQNLKTAGVDTSGIRLSDRETGKAFIEIDGQGQNYITVIAGANHDLDESLLLDHIDLFEQADAVVMQLEIPFPIVQQAAKLCHQKGKLFILDPAPAMRDIPADFFPLVDIAKPNETELSVLTGMPTGSREEIVRAAQKLHALGVRNVMVTLGGQGTLLLQESGMREFPAYPVKAVDTTAAGDCFLASFISQFDGRDFAPAIDFGAKAASIAVTRPGAQSSIPDYEEVCQKFSHS